MQERVLSPEQRERFIHSGFVVLRNVISQAILDEALDVVIETVPEDMTDFKALVAGPDDRHYWNDLADMAPFYQLNEQLHTYAEELVGVDRLQPPSEFTQVAVRYPTGQLPSTSEHPVTTVDGNPHIDIFGDSGELRPFTIGATTYLDDVHPRGGGLTIWPGTHWRVAEYLSEHGVDSYSNEKVGDMIGSRTTPFEVTGSAGTVVLWHNLLVHTGGCHLEREPRIAAFTRFRRSNETKTSHDAAKNPFKYWDGVKQKSSVPTDGSSFA